MDEGLTLTSNDKPVLKGGVGDRPRTYSSPAIIERRRILEEKREVIAEQGIAALSMNLRMERGG